MEEQKRFTLRMDSELFETVKKRAEENKRSVAKEIEFLIELYLKEEEERKSEK